jgi:hypothetical protein
MAVKVELEVRPNNLNTNFYFVLDDPVQGILQDSPTADYRFYLGGKILVDITEYVKSVSITRGKNRELDTFGPGLANIVFNNHDRTFDPTYTASKLYTHIVPRRVLKVSSVTETMGVLDQTSLYLGLVDDWDLSFEVGGDSIAAAACSDALSLFANQVLEESPAAPPEVYVGPTFSITSGGGFALLQETERSDQRIEKVLDQLSYPLYFDPLAADTRTRIIFEGSQILGQDFVADGTNALQYIQLVERSEPGKFYINRFGVPTYLGRNTGRQRGQVEFSDDGNGFNFTSVGVEYGSEYLYNEVLISSKITNGTAIASDFQSQDEYEKRALVREDLLMSTTQAAVDMAVALVTKYSEPEFRFSNMSFIARAGEMPRPIATIDLNEIVPIRFTPNKIGDPIERFGEVIAIEHEITPEYHAINLGFETISNTSWTLSDDIFGRLSAGNTLAY